MSGRPEPTDWRPQQGDRDRDRHPGGTAGYPDDRDRYPTSGYPSMPGGGGGYPNTGNGDPNGYYYNRPGMGSYPDYNYPDNKYPPVYDNRFPDDRGTYYDRRPPPLPPPQMYPDQRYPPSRGQYPANQYPPPSRGGAGSGWYNMPPSGGAYQPMPPSGGTYQPMPPSGGAYQPMAPPNYHPPAYPAANYPPSAGYPPSANALPEPGYTRPYNREYPARPYPNRYPMGPERYPTEAEYERAGYGPYLGIGIFPMPQRGGAVQQPAGYGRPQPIPQQPPYSGGQYYPQDGGQGSQGAHYNPYNPYAPSGYDNAGPGDGFGG